MLSDPDTIRKSGEKGAKFVLSREEKSGYVGEVFEFHKSVWALNNTGHFREANLVVSWVNKNRLRPEGRIEHRLDLSGMNQMLRSFCEKTPVYRDSCLVIGAHRLGRYDVSLRVFEANRERQHRKFGGILDPNAEDDEGEMNPTNTAFFGYAALAVGRLEEAELAGHFFETVIDLQKNPDEKYFNVLHSGNGLVKDFPPEEKALYLFEPKMSGDVLYWMIGMPMGLFAQLYGATKRSKYLERAEWLYRLHRKCPEQVWKLLRSGKSAWALAYLANLTGNREYARRSEQIMRSIIKQQEPNGSWDNSIQVTGEMTMWCTEVVKLIG